MVFALMADLLTDPVFLRELLFLTEPAVRTLTLGLALLLTVSLLVTMVGVLLMLFALLTLFLLATESLLAKDPSRFFFLGGRFGVSELGVRLRPDSSPLEDPCGKEIIMPRIENIETTCATTKMFNFVMQ